jgi:hypothetical protein
MKFMLMIKSDEQTEAGVLPDEAIIAAMNRYNQELANSGALLSAEGLHPTARGARIRLAGGKRSTTDGPFAEAKEQIGGFWVIRASDLDAALEIAARASAACEGPVEVRPFQDDPSITD